MQSFTIGDYRFDVIDHSRTVANGFVVERFIIDVFYQGAPLDLQQGDYSGLSNRTNFEFVGKEVIEVFENQGTREKPNMVKTGEKRGADFRPDFFTVLILVADRALAAKVTGKTIDKVLDSEIVKTQVVEPVNLKADTIDKAVETLTGKVVTDAAVLE